MNFFTKVFYFVIVSNKVRGDCTKLSALNDSLHVIRLYQDVKNNDRPVTLDPHNRDQICENITHSGFFQWLGLIPIDLGRIHYNAHSYDLKQFNVSRLHKFEEYVFSCLLQENFGSKNFVQFHVSKEYNVNQYGHPYMPGRFIFGNLMPEYTLSFYFMILAEVPANAYDQPDFDVEFYYLQLRKYIEPAKSNEVDPLCKLVSNKIEDSNNQHYRFCVSVSRSSYFRDTIRYPGQVAYSCTEKEVSFRTAYGRNEASKKSYRENMINCRSGYVQPQDGENSLYLSRAYNSNEVFAYSYNELDGKIYLVNLSTNISFVDELNSFDFVEY